MKTHEPSSPNQTETGLPKPGHRSAIPLTMAGLALACGTLVIVWAFGFPSLMSTSKSLLAATKNKSGGKTESKTETKADEEAPETTSPSTADKKIKLNYFSASWARVFQDLADNYEMEFVNDHLPTGRFSRFDKAEYSRKDAIRLINKEIEPQGLRLIEKGQFLILIETSLQRPQYPPAILPRKAKPKSQDEDQDETANSGVDRAVYQESVPDKGSRSGANRSRQQAGDADSERSVTGRKSGGSRSVRQTSFEETDDDSGSATSRRKRTIDPAAPNELEDVGATVQHVSYRARNVRAVDLSKRIYRALKTDAELVEAGRNGLPAFRVVSPQFAAKEGASPKGPPPRPIEFMISIDESRNELLIDGSAKSTDAVLKLLRVIDRPEGDQTRTQIKPSTKYVCQIADQLPAEIDRLRAASGSKAIARHQVDGKPLWQADDNQKRAPAVAQNDPAGAPQPDDSDRPSGDALGNFKGEVNIEVIEDLNVMIIRGNERDVEQIMKVIKQIEELSEATAPEVHLIHLKNVDSESLAELLTSVYEKLTKFPGRATQPRESVAIIPVAKPNSLLVVAPGADVESILDLADQLDKPVDPQTEFQVFPLKSAVASDVEALIVEFYKERKALGAKVLVIADARSNAVIVRARPRDLDEIKELINKMDRDEVGAVNQVRIFVLKNAIATDMAGVINSAIQSVLSAPRAAGGGAGGQGGNAGIGGGQVDEQFKSVKSAVLQFLSVDKGTSRQLRSGILSDIRVTPEAHTNSLIVTASEKSMDLVAALIQALDRPTNTVSVIKVFTLENADATQMVQQLNALFNNQVQGGPLTRPLLGGLAIANADDASSNLVPLKFSVDARTNSIIAVGSADAMRVVEAILLRLDESNLRARKNVVVRLNNAPATQIALAVTQFFQQQRDLSQADPNLVSNVEQLEREVIVIPDTVSNNLLVSSAPRYFPDIMAMIKSLDSEPKQVVIQALIVEVQLNNTDEFGIELGMQSPVLFDRSLRQPPVTITQTNSPAGSGGQILTNQVILSDEGTPGFNFNNPGVPLGNNVLAAASSVGGQSLTNFSLGRTNSQLGYGGLVLSAGSNSVNALLRALSSKTKIQILSRPQIRALDSQLAEVFVGQTIPTVTSFQTNATTGVISPTLTQRETGIGMQVTPRINQDGNVVIQLYAYRSQLSQQTVNVTTDSRGQPVGQRITDLSNVRSTVLVPSNSTIVIGGMISSRDETQVRKAPLLSDIPVLGHLFRYDSRTTIRSELLIFLTPRIVNGPEEEECLKEIEMGRLHFIESEAEQAHGPLRALPPPDDVFDDEHTPWIGPGAVPPAPVSPQSPTLQTTPQGSASGMSAPMAVPSPTPSPNSVPPSPLVPPPPSPDPSVTRINAMRALATEKDDSTDGEVTQATWKAPATDKRKTTKQKRPTPAVSTE